MFVAVVRLDIAISGGERYHTVYGREVAQPGSALASGARGRRFKSALPDQ